MTPAHLEDLLQHFAPSQVVEIAVFVAWQANGLRAIHSWDADVLFRSPDVDLAYADGPSLFVTGDRAHPIGPPGEPPRPEDVVPYPDPAGPWAHDEAARVRETWGAWGGPPEDWLDFLAAAPHVLWGWAEFYRLTFGEGVLPRRTKALASVLLASRIGHERWAAGFVQGSFPWTVADGEARRLRDGHLQVFDAKTRAALRYVDRLETDYRGIDEAFFASIARELTAGELVELGMFAGLQMGSIRLARFLAAHDLRLPVSGPR